MPTLKEALGVGVITGDKVMLLFEAAKKHGFAIPAVNVTTSSSANAVLEAARDIGSPIIIQASNGGAAFFAGKSVNNKEPKEQAAIAGAVACALHVRQVAPFYGIPVVLHSDHCAKKLLPWFDGMLKADEEYFAKHGEPLFSSHMLDLSEETDPENIGTCKAYFEKMAPMKIFLEMEIGITGGEEDGVDNTHADQSKLYTQSPQIWAVYETLSKIAPNFSIAAAFGNVHGVYKPGNVKLHPGILAEHQDFVAKKLGVTADSKPCFFVFHGGSGSTEEEIATAVKAGVVKMNVDTDLQWAYWDGLRQFYKKNEGYLQGQIGNPDGEDKPNKKFYDPRVWLRKAEEAMAARVKKACEDLGNVGTLAKEV
uniref:fructose-bisphosphate aldolase n=2 Tax=Chromera velia TaxID=505693 RepID=X2DAQ9_9ALVE|nr:class II fructose-1,6-bisphosphate aldolase [Chromera velia]|mmetsp:Transcript_40693/g.80189  ORF Transcript_40693/g.80189 Transcript_40693/m.80189 type:complete len:367 (+) Transcript_40693:162-1262(+)|eukprot:Cvel_24470.t1-p1 / transcript=Cvel_24470.t1 / gene=Cvel_24470 / organism=Chromera_velia_CCMP2878 / gene_product=Fructose-bisphosphate aldolase, putative / transcript_product=Fructose-bisphosphate aldolase, putative / location=Cvel_scaffold2648:13619-16090(+) / protein_length=366 / sequence_SO=supercontig / SO=protein_coding / is_pseudo=false